MKTINIISRICLAVLIVLGLFACKKDKDLQNEAGLQVIQTTYDSSYTASEGFIKVSEAGFTLNVDAPWLKATVKDEKTISLKLEANASSFTRNAVVKISKGKSIQEVTITQFGRNDYSQGLRDITAERDGGVATIPVHFPSKATLTLSPAKKGASTDWVKAEIKDSKLIIKFEAFAPDQYDTREAFLKVEAGLFSKTVSLKQTWGKPRYKDILGDYVLQYKETQDGKTKQIDVRLENFTEKNTFVLMGLSVGVLLTWNEELGVLKFPSMELPKPKNFNEKEQLFIGVCGNGYKGEDGVENNKIYPKYAMLGKWIETTTKKNLMFVFPTFKEKDGKVIGGMFIYKVTADGKIIPYPSLDGKGIHTISDFSLTRKL